MISLSLGFAHVHSPDLLGDEIRDCLYAKIPIFASASNDGADGARTYPAKYEGVICAHAADWQGAKSKGNPGLEAGRNFMFVGEHVRPTWSDRPTPSTEQMPYRSGSSCATPVAVAVAAFMIGYIHKKMPGFSWVTEPCSPKGIRAIFGMMARKIDGYDWVSPVSYLEYTKESKIHGDLEQELVGSSLPQTYRHSPLKERCR